ncbi:FecR family protein [Parabacteroides chongii]|uniref:FecR family protein n=1 Tax=Parabacteroides chongii TaxID=2685834 RepID=UPI00240DE8B0|nr:FecR domain-containing protein [Parabacteroides chongii]WFE86068.1 FecR domain-containing protein [Parabacteroides chongii]
MNEDILIRFLTHRCTPEEIKEIDQWIAASQANADWLFEMERIWSLKDQLRFSDKQEIEMAYARFMSGLQEKETKVQIVQRRSAYIVWLKYAAAIVLIGLLSTNLFYQLREEPVAMNMVEVPNGQRVSLTLSDGTKVWLNSHSKFTYPARFSSKERDVKLEGEGFFEVAHNEKSPFVVHADLLHVKVLGTKFNVRAYDEEPSSITLAEGKVEVATNDNEHKVTLKPNEQVTYSKKGGLIVNKSVNASLTKSWTLGEAAYINKQLADIVSDLERRFNVHITVEDPELTKEVFTSRFKETATIDQVLTLLKDTRKLDYKIQGDHIRIYKPLK